MQEAIHAGVTCTSPEGSRPVGRCIQFCLSGSRCCPIATVQIVLSLANATSYEGKSPTKAVAHDASAEDMRKAIISLVDDSLDNTAGEIRVSRDPNGAKGLQTFRYHKNAEVVTRMPGQDITFVNLRPHC